MGKLYSAVKDFENELYPIFRGRFLKECLLFEDMAELILEAGHWHPKYLEHEDDSVTACMTLHARMFNDFEASKLLILYGLSEQAVMPMRDSIEAMLLTRLFLHIPKRAEQWIGRYSQYSAGDVNSQLCDLGINPIEYNFYGMLSHLGHSNMLASMFHVDETGVDGGEVLRVVHYGVGVTRSM